MSEIDEEGLLQLGEGVGEEFDDAEDVALWEDVDLEALGAEQDNVIHQEETEDFVEHDATAEEDNTIEIHTSTDAPQEISQDDDFAVEVLAEEEIFDDDDSDDEDRRRDRFHTERTNLPQKPAATANTSVTHQPVHTLNVERYGPTASHSNINQPRKPGPFVARARGGRRGANNQPQRFNRNTRAHLQQKRMMNNQRPMLQQVRTPLQLMQMNSHQARMQQNMIMNRPGFQGQSGNMNQPVFQGQSGNMIQPGFQGQIGNMNRPIFQGQSGNINRPVFQGQSGNINRPVFQGQGGNINRPVFQRLGGNVNQSVFQGHDMNMNQPRMQQQPMNINQHRMQPAVLQSQQQQPLVPGMGGNIQPLLHRAPHPQQNPQLQNRPQIVQPLSPPRNIQPARPLLEVSPPPQQRRNYHINPNFIPKSNINMAKPLREQSLEETFGFPIRREDPSQPFQQADQYSQGPGTYQDIDVRASQPGSFQTPVGQSPIVIQPDPTFPNSAQQQFSPGVPQQQGLNQRFVSPTSQQQSISPAQQYNLQVLAQDELVHSQQHAFSQHVQDSQPQFQGGNQSQFISPDQQSTTFTVRNDFVPPRSQQQPFGGNQGENFTRTINQYDNRPQQQPGISGPPQQQQNINWQSPPNQAFNQVSPNIRQQRPNFNPQNQQQNRPGQQRPLQPRIANAQNINMRAKSKALLNKARTAQMNRGGAVNAGCGTATPTGVNQHKRTSALARLGGQKPAKTLAVQKPPVQCQAQPKEEHPPQKSATPFVDSKKKADRAARFAITSEPIRKQAIKRISSAPADDVSPPKQSRSSFTITRTVNTASKVSASQSESNIAHAIEFEPKASKSETNVGQPSAGEADIDSAYLAKLEEQKRKREEILRRKEESRLKRAAAQTPQQHVVGVGHQGDDGGNQGQQQQHQPAEQQRVNINRQVVQGNNQQQKRNNAPLRGGVARRGNRGGMRGRGGRQTQPLTSNTQQQIRPLFEQQKSVPTQEQQPLQDESPRRTVLMGQSEEQARIVMPASQPGSRQPTQGTKVLMTNVNPDTDPQHIINVAKQCGHVYRCQLAKSKKSAQVTFQSAQQAAYFANKWDRKFLNNRLVKVQVIKE